MFSGVTQLRKEFLTYNAIKNCSEKGLDILISLHAIIGLALQKIFLPATETNSSPHIQPV